MATVRIPLVAGREPYRLTVNLDNVSLRLALRWNERDAHWYLDVLQGDALVLSGVKLVSSDNLLTQFGHMQVDGRLPPGTFRVVDSSQYMNDPDTDTLGVTVRLLYDEAA